MLINGGLIAAQQIPCSGGVFGASFDGTNDYLTRGAALTGVVDGKIGIFAARVRMLGGNGSIQILSSNRDATIQPFIIERFLTNKIRIIGNTTGAITTLLLDSTATITADGSYHNILMSWDVGTDDNHVYFDGVSGINQIISDDANIDYTSVEFSVGAYFNAANKLNADLDVIYLNLAEKMDFSVEANRLKYFDASGNWVPSRTGGGSEPTGNKPILYLPNVYNQFWLNHGTGGNFTETGALTEPA